MANKKQKSITKVDKAFIDFIFSKLLKHGSLKIIGLGIFKLQKMKARKGFNPYSKESVKFPAYIKISFSPTKKLKLAIQKWK